MISPNVTWGTGIIESVNDPLKQGRVQVRIHGVHTSDLSDIPTDTLPWAQVMMPNTSASMNGIGNTHGLVNGSMVMTCSFDKFYEQLIVMGSFLGNQTQDVDTSKGFNDPDGVYPKSNYKNESDVNRLAREDNIIDTITQTKQNSRETGITDSSGTWGEPEYETESAPIYPNNKVTETTSGHVMEVDDTSGKERLHTYHKSGTFEEIYATGDKMIKVVGNDYEVVIQNKKLYVKGALDITSDSAISLLANNVLLGTDGEPIPLGEALLDWLANHTHNTANGPSSVPIEAPTASLVSKNNTTA